MHVHACAQVLVGTFAQEVLDKLVGVFEVVSAASPLPRLAVLQVGGLVARAALHASCAARFGHSVGQARRGDGIQEGCLFKSWKSRMESDKWDAGKQFSLAPSSKISYNNPLQKKYQLTLLAQQLQWRFWSKNAVSSLSLQINVGSWATLNELYRATLLRFLPVVYLHFKTSPHVLQLLRRTLFCCDIFCGLQNFIRLYVTLWAWVDNDWNVIFDRTYPLILLFRTGELNAKMFQLPSSMWIIKESSLPLFSMLARWRPSKVQFHLSKRNWYWHSRALMVMASLRVSATPGSRLHILRCFFSSLSRSHSL